MTLAEILSDPALDEIIDGLPQPEDREPLTRSETRELARLGVAFPKQALVRTRARQR